MPESIKRAFRGAFIFEWYYIVVIIAYILTVFSGAVRPGVTASLLMVIVALELVVKKQISIKSVMDVLIVAYFTYKAASYFWLIKGGLPARVYTGEAAVSLIPMIFYFAGRACKGRIRNFYCKFIAALVILGLVSLAFYIIAPQFYLDYLYAWSYMSKPDAATMRVRMQSVMGCTLFGAIMVFGMCVGIYFLFAMGKDIKTKRDRILGIFTIVFTLFFAFMSNQRSSMVAGIVMLLYINILLFTKFENIPRKYFVFEIAGIVILLVLVCLVRYDFIIKIWGRLSSLPTAVSERSEQWVAAVNNMYSSWFGNGLGANGHKALGIEGTHVIADGGLIKAYCEEGVIGFSMFLYILFLSVRKCLANIKVSYAELGVIIVGLLLSIGSNVLAFQLATPIFWFAIGRIWDNPDADERLSNKPAKSPRAKRF